MTVAFYAHEDRQQQAQALAAIIADKLEAAMRESGEARLVVPGGSTPVALFEALAQKDIAWWRVHVSLNDDRQVPEDHEASNVGLVRKHLLQHKAAAAVFEPMETAAITDADVLVLGMGEDGHTASLFPGAPELATALDPEDGAALVQIVPDPLPPHAPFARISMTLSAILRARYIILLICGRTKQAVYEQARVARPEDMPVAAILQQDARNVSVHWAP
jgi:6-phosphogluconolactonase